MDDDLHRRHRSVADAATTLHFNPSLSREGNPMVPLLDINKDTLWIYNTLGIVLFIIGILLYWKLPSKKIFPLQIKSNWLSS